MRSVLTVALLALFYSSSSQVIKFTIEDSTKKSLHTLSWTSKEKTAYQDGKSIIQIDKGGANMLQFAYTAKYNAQKHAVTIHKYDEGGNELATNKLDNGERAFGPVPTVCTQFNNKILLFYYRYIDKDSMKLYVSEVDKNDLSLKNTQQLFSYHQKNVGIIGMMSMSSGIGEIILRASPDESKLLLVVMGNGDQIFSSVFDNKMNVLRNKITEVPRKGSIQASDAFVENSGNNIIIFSRGVFSANSSKADEVKTILIQKVNNSEHLVEFNTIGEENIYDIHFKVLKNTAKVYLFGDYAGPIYFAGIWLTDIETETFKINKPVLIPYPEDFAKRVYKIGFADRKKSNYGILNTDYEMVEFENGDLAFCGSPVLKMVGIKYTVYFGGPVIVAFLSKDLKKNLFTMIPRHQNHCSGSACVYIPYHDKLIVFYNDYVKNINSELLNDDVHQKGGAIFRELSLAYAIIKKDGSIESRKLIEEGLSRMNFYNTAECEIISDKKLFIPSVSEEKKTEIMKVAKIIIE